MKIFRQLPHRRTLLRRIGVFLYLSLIFLSACSFNKAIRGGEIVDKYDIRGTGLPIEEVYYKNLDGTALYAWFLKKENYRRVPTIVFLHGSRGNIRDYLPVIRNLYDNIEANIFACDFPGTGASKGAMSLENAYRMTLAAIDYLETERGIRKDRMVLYGASMGASLAFYGASKRDHVLVITDSGVTSASDYMKRYIPFGLPDFLIKMFGENFNNYSLVGNMRSPKLFLHGTGDRAIDIKYAQRLYEHASGPKDFLWMDGGHVLSGDPERAKELSKKVRAFFSAHLP